MQTSEHLSSPSLNLLPSLRTLLRTLVLSGPVYCAKTARLSQRYPPIARYGVFGVSTWPIGCDTPSPFSVRSPLEERFRGGGAIENKAHGCDTPLCDTISKGYCRDPHGGVSRTGPLSPLFLLKVSATRLPFLELS